jgi:carboxypeptidase Taq
MKEGTHVEQALQPFRELIRKIKSYADAEAALYWDMRTGMPKKGVEARSETLGFLAAERFKLTVSDEMGEWLARLEEPAVWDKLGELDRRHVKEARREYDRSVKIPPEKHREFVILTNKAEATWEEAKQKADFSLLAPYLERIVEMTREFIGLWGYEGHPYNTLLDQYEPGMTVDVLDRVFGELREETVPLVKAAAERSREVRADFLKLEYPIERQREFSLYILREMGYDFEAGRLDETEHPFMITLGPGDARVTTRYKTNDVWFALSGTIHEGGHALYEQNLAPELAGTLLFDGASMGIHESQSRFWEIYVGSSRPFWRRYFPELKRLFPQQLADVDAEAFYRAINRSQPSLIRIEADELTYNLHIIIRYELEKALIGGEIEVKDLPELWNRKYAEYLGVVPAHDGEGVLQDVHWSGGSFGYFPTYSLGNMYAAQLMHALRWEMPDAEARIERGELGPIRQWLTDRIHRHGKSRTPDELIRGATGEPLNPRYLIEHLKEKFA